MIQRGYGRGELLRLPGDRKGIDSNKMEKGNCQEGKKEGKSFHKIVARAKGVPYDDP